MGPDPNLDRLIREELTRLQLLRRFGAGHFDNRYFGTPSCALSVELVPKRR